MDIKSLVGNAEKVWLSTHIGADGDGLGSEFAFFHALQKIGKNVRIVHNDPTPIRYKFLTDQIQVADSSTLDAAEFSENDLCLIFDTHDPKLCQPLISKLLLKKVKIIFVDHHVVLKTDTENAVYHIDETASCTGELTLDLIESLGIVPDAKIAGCLYASLIFDTQSFKTMRDPVRILEMAKKLVIAGADHKSIHRQLFENWTLNKFNYLSKLIKAVIYREDTAIINITKADLKEFNLNTDEVSDIVDLFMGLRSMNICVVIREENENFFKLSFRSRKTEILSWAREFGGGGHLYSAGAWVKGKETEILAKINSLIDRFHEN